MDFHEVSNMKKVENIFTVYMNIEKFKHEKKYWNICFFVLIPLTFLSVNYLSYIQEENISIEKKEENFL